MRRPSIGEQIWTESPPFRTILADGIQRKARPNVSRWAMDGVRLGRERALWSVRSTRPGHGCSNQGPKSEEGRKAVGYAATAKESINYVCRIPWLRFALASKWPTLNAFS